MPLLIGCLVTFFCATYFTLKLITNRKLLVLKDKLPIAFSTHHADGPAYPLVSLSIDLMRKSQSDADFADLDPAEQRVALHALAVEELPRWMVRVATMRLNRTEADIINKLQQIKTSRPIKKEMHFGAIQRQLQLRSPRET